METNGKKGGTIGTKKREKSEKKVEGARGRGWGGGRRARSGEYTRREACEKSGGGGGPRSGNVVSAGRRPFEKFRKCRCLSSYGANIGSCPFSHPRLKRGTSTGIPVREPKTLGRAEGPLRHFTPLASA